MEESNNKVNWVQTGVFVLSLCAFWVVQWATVKKDISNVEATNMVHGTEINILKQNVAKIEERQYQFQKEINDKLEKILIRLNDKP